MNRTYLLLGIAVASHLLGASTQAQVFLPGNYHASSTTHPQPEEMGYTKRAVCRWA